LDGNWFRKLSHWEKKRDEKNKMWDYFIYGDERSDYLPDLIRKVR
jgi:hypothetical protein